MGSSRLPSSSRSPSRPDSWVPSPDMCSISPSRKPASWHDRDLDITIAVNVSRETFHSTELQDNVATLLRKWSVPPTSLELEITESVVMSDPRRAIEVLQSLNALGVNTVLDDFGTGYSSLAYLKRLPVGQLKIDGAFVADMATNDEDAAIVSSTINLPRSLELSVVAEGVESETVWQRLHEYGCDYVQGYYLSRPLPAEQMTRWLEQHGAHRHHADAPSNARILSLAERTHALGAGSK